MDTQTLLKSHYLDLIFQGRNKAYGSYQLRITYADRMLKAGLYIFFAIAMLSGYMLWGNRTRPLPEMPLVEKTITLTEVTTQPPKPPVVVPPAPPAEPAKIKMILHTPPDILKDDAVNAAKTVADQDKLNDAVAGNMTITDGGIGTESVSGPSGHGGSETVVESSVHSEPVIEKFVEQWPEFPGGEAKLNEYLNAHLQYPSKALNAGQQGNVKVKFVVNEDGTISNVSAPRGFGYGSEEEAIRVVAGMPKWKPGRNNGRAVKVWFYLPIIFRLN